MPDALILSGPRGLEDALQAASRSQSSIILEPHAAYHPDAHSCIRHYARSLGTQLFLPPEFADDAPNSKIVIDCSLRETPLKNRLSAHRERWGQRAAALIRPIALKITFPLTGEAIIASDIQAELNSEQTAMFSEEAGCSYLICDEQNQLSFFLFSTKHSLQWQEQLCQTLMIEPLILAQPAEE